MLNPHKDILETRLHMWKSFFETGRDNFPSYAEASHYDVDAVTEAAARAGVEYDDLELIELAEAVDLMAVNYLLREDAELHAALMADDPLDEPDYVPPLRAAMSDEARAELMAGLDAILNGA